MSFGHTIAAGGVANIEFKIVPGAYDDFREVQVTLARSDESRHTVILHIAPVSPFAGWPQQALATVDGEDIIVEIDAWYRDIVNDIAAYADGESLLTDFDRDTGLIRVHRSNKLQEGIELVMLVGVDEPQRWAGNIRVNSDMSLEP